MKTFTSRSRSIRSGTVAALALGAAAVIVLPTAATAAPVVSQGEGRLLTASLLGTPIDGLLELAGATAVNATGEPTVVANVPLDATALGALNIQVAPGIGLFGDTGLIRLGAVGQYAEARPDGSSVAFSGTVSAAPGLLDIETTPEGSNVGTPGAGDSASITVGTAALLGGADLVNLNIGIGAVAASAQQLPGGVPATGDYTISDLSVGVGGTLLDSTLSQLSPILTTLLGTVTTLTGVTIENPVTPGGTIEVTLDELLAAAEVASLNELPEGTNLLQYLPEALVTKLTSIVSGLLTEVSALVATFPLVGALLQAAIDLANGLLTPILTNLATALGGPLGTAIDGLAQLDVNNKTTNPDGSFTQNALTIGLGADGSIAEVALANATVGPNAGIEGIPVANAESLLIAGGILGAGAIATAAVLVSRRRSIARAA
ncbi:hypothetical protein M2152_002474 [Microbacteriaceae bacterium SG_E_30_P1]|uniref:Choice-of-anchor G family protein n=1 Tax=Antiquaquibacter oligotrophicus TaxID=2880260 RepID=A0ABT6KT96_9MICO|nr:choice-of-anchor G family protein [Antiquaquibacter oligotrophicus]MDH6182292.1 hypothetical protein [Antiquaquibacter oligotrophicus]UDF12052.1 choice-of-anchor G family protein [Antiquaquibacter oligotrophicus]